jgi:hypothetical protein
MNTILTKWGCYHPDVKPSVIACRDAHKKAQFTISMLQCLVIVSALVWFLVAFQITTRL